MKGFIVNLTIKGKGQIFQGDKAFTVEPGDLLLFHQRRCTITAGRRMPGSGITAGSISAAGLLG
jgi:hypothetical protein